MIVLLEKQSSVNWKGKEIRNPAQQTKKAFMLACIEQLVPIRSEESLPMVFQTCLPYVGYFIPVLHFPGHINIEKRKIKPIDLLIFRHLFDPSHRETFESAHSVVLGIFAAHAQKVAEAKNTGASQTNVNGPSFVESLVPFYVGCLIEVS